MMTIAGASRLFAELVCDIWPHTRALASSLVQNTSLAGETFAEVGPIRISDYKSKGRINKRLELTLLPLRTFA